jgi:gliding motility-associated-like protein
MTGNEFYPDSANVGTNTITYTYTDSASGCSGTAQATITVKANPTLTLTISGDTVCDGQSFTITPTTSIDVFNITYSQLGGSVITRGLNPVNVFPSGSYYCVVASAINAPNNCVTNDTVCVDVILPPVSTIDTAYTCELQAVTINLDTAVRDTQGYPVVISILHNPNHGTLVSGGAGIYTYTSGYFFGLDSFKYQACASNCTSTCDTGEMYISVCYVPIRPVITDTTITIYQNDSADVCPIIYDLNGLPLVISNTACDTLNGTLTFTSDSCLQFVPDSNWTGTQTLCVRVCDTTGLCDTGTVLIVVKPLPVRAVNDTVNLCGHDTLNISVHALATSGPNPVVFTGVGTPVPSGHGTVSFSADTLTYISNGDTGAVSMVYHVCDSSALQDCDSATLVLHIHGCAIPVVPPVLDTTVMNTPDTICLGGLVTSSLPWHISTLCSPLNGSTSNSDSCFVYSPKLNWTGSDTFCVVVCNTNGCDTAKVIVVTLDSLIKAVAESCDMDSTRTGNPVTIAVLDNDILPPATDTVVSIYSVPFNGTVMVNSNNTITYQPGKNFEGTDQFVYQVCAETGHYKFCDTAGVCVRVLPPCFIPNGFTPNGDGLHDTYEIPCNDYYPLASLEIFDRWGMEVWHSDGHYLNDWGGANQQGTKLPDGTYYIIYNYNDGTNKSIAKFVEIRR